MRRAQAMVVLCGVVGAFLLAVAPAASAQTGYPPGPCTAVSGVQSVGNVPVGQRFLLQLAPTCLFTVGTPVTVTVNGVTIPGKVANASGRVTVDITVVSAAQLSIDDPVLAPAICGTNTAIATGASGTALGGTSTQTANFTITCPPVAAVASVSGAATPVLGQLLSRTGADTLRYVAVAVALLAAGSVALVVTRRRRAAGTV